MPPGRLIIVCGLPGAGKTTHATAIEQHLGATRFCPDEWLQRLAIDLWNEQARSEVEALQWSLAQRLLALGGTAIIEWGTWGRSERDTLREGARAVGASVELHYLTASLDVLHARIVARDLESPPIERADLERWAGTIEVPTREEFALYDPPGADLPEHLRERVLLG